MTFQNVVNRELAKYLPGQITRENPVVIEGYFAEGNDVKAGGFLFAGTNADTQVKGSNTGATAVVGVAKRTPYQTNFTGSPSDFYNEGAEITAILKGYVAVAINSGAEKGQNVFVDPDTGLINASSGSSISATAGSLVFANVDTTISSWTAISNGDLSLKIDGVAKNLTSLNFSSATDMNNVAGVINTALSSDGTCAYNSTTGLTITSATTGKTSSVEFVSSSALATLLGTGVSVAGAGAMINTGWKVNMSCGNGEITEIYNI